MPDNPPSIMDRMLKEGIFFNFFQAVYLLEQIMDSSPGANKTVAEKIRFRSNPGLRFPASDIQQIRISDRDPERVEFILNFMGLYGVSSPLPQFFYTEIAKQSERSEALQDFLDIFNHRLYDIFYHAWKKYRGYLSYQQGGKDSHSQRLLSLAGLGTRNATMPLNLSAVRVISFIGRLSSRNRNKEGLTAMLSDYFEGIQFNIQEFIPRWVAIKNKVQLGSKAPDTRPILGENVTIGDKILDYNGKFRIRVGPLSLAQFYKFKPGGEYYKIVEQFVRMYVRDWLEFDLILLLKSAEIPDIILDGKSNQVGWNTWLGRPAEEIVSVRVC